VNIAHRGARKRSAPLTRGVRVRGQGSVLDQYLPHFDAVIRQGVVLAARPEEVYAWLRSFDFAQMCEPVGRAIEDMRAVPRSLAKVAAKARRVLPTASFVLEDAVRGGVILLAGRPLPARDGSRGVRGLQSSEVCQGGDRLTHRALRAGPDTPEARVSLPRHRQFCPGAFSAPVA
jgi:hypothetical protein